MSYFWHLWPTFVRSKCKRILLRSQIGMRLFLWFLNSVHYRETEIETVRESIVSRYAKEKNIISRVSWSLLPYSFSASDRSCKACTLLLLLFHWRWRMNVSSLSFNEEGIFWVEDPAKRPQSPPCQNTGKNEIGSSRRAKCHWKH